MEPTTAPPTTSATTTRGQLEEELNAIRFRSIFVATKLIILKPAEESYTSSITTSALSFNLAMCYHTLSLSVPCRAQAYRLSALRLYKVAYHLRKNAANRRKPAQPEQGWKPKMLDLAILNNVGTLLIQTGDRGAARSYFERLSTSISQVDAPSKVDCEGFLRNLTILFPSRVLAPAA
jgi:hypothetical protein